MMTVTEVGGAMGRCGGFWTKVRTDVAELLRNYQERLNMTEGRVVLLQDD